MVVCVLIVHGDVYCMSRALSRRPSVDVCCCVLYTLYQCRPLSSSNSLFCMVSCAWGAHVETNRICGCFAVYAVAVVTAAGGFAGCMHGMGCMRCLAAAALQHQLQVTLAYPINMPEEPWLGSLAQLDAEQLFAVALVLVVMVGYVRATFTQQVLTITFISHPHMDYNNG